MSRTGTHTRCRNNGIISHTMIGVVPVVLKGMGAAPWVTFWYACKHSMRTGCPGLSSAINWPW